MSSFDLNYPHWVSETFSRIDQLMFFQTTATTLPEFSIDDVQKAQTLEMRERNLAAREIRR